MSEMIAGVLEVGRDGQNIIVNHPDLKPDEHGVGHIVFSAQQARNLAKLLLKHADYIDQPARETKVFKSDRDMDELVNTFKRKMLSRGFVIGAIFFCERTSNSTGLLLSSGLPLSSRLAICDDVKEAAEVTKQKFMQEVQ